MCPTCNKEIIYSSKYSHRNAKQKNSNCKSCGLKKSITPERRIKMSERVSGNKNPMFGRSKEDNPFYGKKHTEDTINKMKLVDRSYTKTEEFKEKMRSVTSGKNNGMYGKNFYEIWVEKYGVKVAEQKMISFKEKQSKNNRGSKNNMYGKPSPIGSGNGWSGWYNGWYFRSLKELTYMIKVIERFNLKWDDGEKKKYSIKYENHNGESRTYRPDFFIGDKYLVEIKPKSLHSSSDVCNKMSAALKFCEKNDYVYKLRDIEKLNFNDITHLFKTKQIKFIDRYEKKMLKLLND